MLHKKLYGYKDQSHQGKYTYNRPGLLQEVEGKKIIDAVLLVKTKKEAKKVTDLLHEHGANTYIFDVLSKIEF
ncbi:hypothetical protein AKJ66_04315 [candidate division MSBL1 archaeon SCGC-AAA259E22]|uniref:Uncharacterized protein n=1 Tax=candidate division MSBL1 archaeon SCGC-AAA259E22 TaxID=1698265 RepID=A0A133UDR4_9EURY|nr:hypothetical protein AKJ66_04315 [candidate division MSBL1 archaeon SCGC-AAA259E22]